MSPLEELQSLNARVESATELEDLRPIFERMTAISHENPDDFEVIIAADQLRRHIVDKGKLLREQQESLEQDEYLAEPEPLPPVDSAHNNSDAFGPPKTSPPGSVIDSTQLFSPPPPPPPTGTFATPTPPPPPVAPPRPSAISAIPPKPPSASGTGGGKKLALVGALAGILAALSGGVFWFVSGHKFGSGSAPSPAVAGGAVVVNFVTTPPGAAIQVNGETKCTSTCRVELAPGNYQITAVLDGFEPGAAALNVVAGNPIDVSLSLTAQAGVLRIVSDVDAATVVLDGKPAGNIQEGQFTLDRIAPGPHVVRVVGKGSEVEFPFEMASGKQPMITGPVKAPKMVAVLVTSMGPAARVYSNVSSKVAVNGQAQGQTDPKGLDLKDVPAGEQTLSLGEGKGEKRLVVSFGPAPSIAAFLKQPEVTTGTLVVSTGEDDVTVAIDGKEARRKTKRGSLRIPAVGTVVVHVAKPGFQSEADQTVEIKKGEEKKISFVMKPLPRMAAMLIHNGVPGTQILLDDQPIGRVGPDGSFSTANLHPGEHSIEARREGFLPKKFQRSVKAGETLNLTGSDLALAVAGGTVHVTVSPADATLLYRRADDTQLKSATATTLKLDPGNYVFVARAPGHVERTITATVAPGDTRNIEISLNKVEAPKPRPTINWAGWSKEGDEFVRRGGNRVVVASGPMLGTLTFTAHLMKGGGVFRNAKLRWFVDEGTGSTQYELDKRKLQAKGPAGQRSREVPKGVSDDEAKTYTIEIELSADRITHRVKSEGGWVTLDNQAAKVGTDTRFGFMIPGNDEISISDLRFTPK